MQSALRDHARQLFPELTDDVLDDKAFANRASNYRVSQSWYRNSPDKLEADARKLVAEALAEIHRRTHLECFASASREEGRCYVTGHQDWRRRDGAPLSQVDIDALNKMCLGQSTSTQNKPGDLVARVYWACDSSD